MIENLKAFVLAQTLILAALIIAAFLGSGMQLAASIAAGGALMLLNVGLLRWSWGRLFAKKSIAWTVVIIVIKYAVLIGSIFYIARTRWFSPLGVGLGITSFVFAILVIAAIHYKNEKLREKLG